MSAVEFLKRKVIGAPEQLPRRVLAVAFLLTFTVATAGAWLAVTSGLESATTSSTGYLRPVLELATNTWTYVVLLAVIMRGLLLYRDQRYAQQAAAVTGYTVRSVQRLAEEAKEPDGTTRVIATSEDDRDTIGERILAALDGADDDRVKLNEELFGGPDPEDVAIEDGDLRPALDERDEQLRTVLSALEDRERELDERLKHGATDLEEQDELLEEEVANLELQESVLGALSETVPEPSESTIIEAEPDVSEEPDADRGRVSSVLAKFFGRGDDVADEDDEDESEDAEEWSDEWLEEMKLLKLDVATSINFDRLLWQFAVPALVTIAGLLIVARFWIKPYLYPPLFATGVLVGLAYYVRQSRKRSKRLEELRRDADPVEWRDVAVLVKEVEVAETTLQMGWLAGDTFVHDDREEFAEEVSHRVYELLNGLEPSPSILEKQADQIQGMKPDLHAFRDQEKKLVMDRLLQAVENSQDGLVPKAKLIEDVVEWDIEQRKLMPGERGDGHDPDVVREAYRDLVPAALVEQELQISEDSEETLTAVRHRRDPIPPEFGAIRARFSNQFSSYAEWEPLYELPSVDDVLEEEPYYANVVGVQEASA
jgi:hypothetical protein